MNAFEQTRKTPPVGWNERATQQDAESKGAGLAGAGYGAAWAGAVAKLVGEGQNAGAGRGVYGRMV